MALASFLKQKRHKLQITQLKSTTGEILTEETQIADRFKQYYAELYSTRTVSTETEIIDYLSQIKLPFLTNTHREFLMRPFEKEEILMAISSMKAGGAPGSQRAHNYTKARLDRQRDLQENIEDKMWTYCCTSIRRISLNGRHRLIHFKYSNRVYHTPERLHRFGLRDTPACEQCATQTADFYHLAWSCPEIFTYCEAIFRVLGKITEQVVTPDPTIALLCYTKQISKNVRILVDMGLLLAKRRVAMCWSRPPHTDRKL